MSPHQHTVANFAHNELCQKSPPPPPPSRSCMRPCTASIMQVLWILCTHLFLLWIYLIAIHVARVNCCNVRLPTHLELLFITSDSCNTCPYRMWSACNSVSCKTVCLLTFYIRHFPITRASFFFFFIVLRISYSTWEKGDFPLTTVSPPKNDPQIQNGISVFEITAAKLGYIDKFRYVNMPYIYSSL